MAIQSQQALTLDALSILNDVPPNPAQKALKPGVHLRLFVGEDRSFPRKGGYYLFRRRVRRSTETTLQCVMPRLKDRDPAVVGSRNSIDTGIGTLAANSGQVLKPRSIGAPGTLGIAAFGLDRVGLRFSLPAGTTTSAFTVSLIFVPAFEVYARDTTVQPQVTIVVYRGTTVVARRVAVATPFRQDVTIGAERPGADAIEISGPGDLLELCYAGMPAAAAKNAPAKSLAASLAAVLPGPGWEMIPDLPSVIKLPLKHPQYAASPGPESINASKAIASARVHYGAWQDSFNAGTLTPGAGTIALTNGSPLVAGSGTNWTDELLGSLIRLPLTGSDYTAYAVMAVLAPDCIVLSRTYSGTTRSNATYQLATDDDFAELHDRVASLLQSPNDMRAAMVPPPLDRGSVGSGKCVRVSASAQVIGLGTQWTASLAGCWIEIGPAWFQSTYLAGSNIYRIQSVGGAGQLTLDRPFAGVPYHLPHAKCDYRIFARAAGDDPNADALAFDFKPMDLLELASLMPGYAQAMGLYGIDTKVSKGDIFDYIAVADHNDRFAQQAGNALTWLNGTPDFTGDAVDGFIKFGVLHAGSPPLAPPTQLELFRLPTAGARISIAHPDRADSDVGVSVLNAASWADPNATQVMPVMLNVSRLSRGTDETNLTPVGNDAAGYDDLGRLLPSRRDSANAPDPPAGWPTDPIHFIDSGPDHSGLDVGWYSYRAYAIDLWGRFSRYSAPIPWKNVDTSAAKIVDAIHLADFMPPPPPAGVRAWILDDRDPYVVRDAAFKQWRNQFPDPAPSPVIGLRLNFRWPWSHQNQGPDLHEFRVYVLDNPINARTGRVTSVSPVSGEPTWSLVTLDLDLSDSTPADDYKGASLQAGDRGFTILPNQSATANQATNVQLIVENGGPSQTVPPEADVDGAIVIPSGHPRHKEPLHPGNWTWLAAIPENLAGTRYDIDMVEDSAAIPFDAETNTFTGAQATWNGSAFVLDAIPASHQPTAVRPGIDILELSSDEPPGYYVIDIQSVSGLQIVPARLPDPVPLPATSFAWRIGPANAGLRGLAGSWNAAIRRFSLDGTPNLSNVTPGADLIYIAAAGATPANLDFFFAIESLDAASRTLTLTNTTHLSALPDGASFSWQIGRPVRCYEIFLPNPAVPRVTVTTDPSIQLAPFNLLTPALNQPVRHGTVGVSSADKRTEVADQYWPLRGLTGNESYVSGPAPVFRVLRDPPPAPTYTWNVTRLLATRANYRGESYFTVRWDNPGAGYHAHIFRAMDSSIFLAHWQLNGPLPVAGAPPGISVLSGFDARKASFETHSAAATAAQTNADDATYAAESALARTEYNEAAKLYDQLDDVTLWWLAGRHELADAYMQVTIKTLDLSNPANADRLGPDNDPGTFVASPTACAYVDTLPGESTNKYFYAVILLDGAQNRSALGSPTPPVYLPKVVPPSTLAVTKVLGGELQITIQWARNRDPDLAEYRIYRADDVEQARDIRSMQRVGTVLQSAVDTAKPAVEWTDSSNLIGGQKYFYRLSAVDTAGNESIATEPRVGIAVDTRVPEPPVWTEQTWLLHRKADDAFTDWPADGIVPTGHEPVLRLGWQCETPDPRFVVRRWADERQLWVQPNNIEIRPNSVDQFSFNLLDYDVDPALPNSYRLRVRSPSGVWSTEDAVVVASVPGLTAP